MTGLGQILQPRLRLSQHCGTCGRVLDEEEKMSCLHVVAMVGALGTICKCGQSIHRNRIVCGRASCRVKRHWESILIVAEEKGRS